MQHCVLPLELISIVLYKNQHIGERLQSQHAGMKHKQITTVCRKFGNTKLPKLKVVIFHLRNLRTLPKVSEKKSFRNFVLFRNFRNNIFRNSEVKTSESLVFYSETSELPTYSANHYDFKKEINRWKKNYRWESHEIDAKTYIRNRWESLEIDAKKYSE